MFNAINWDLVLVIGMVVMLIAPFLYMAIASRNLLIKHPKIQRRATHNRHHAIAGNITTPSHTALNTPRAHPNGHRRRRRIARRRMR